MFKVTSFLLVCLVSLATVMGITPQQPWPEVVNARKYFCQAQGPSYLGACIIQNLQGLSVNSRLRCDVVFCAEMTSVAGVYNAVPTGPARDGMKCSSKGVCINGVCISAKTARLPIPFQLGPDTEYPCRTLQATRPLATRYHR